MDDRIVEAVYGKNEVDRFRMDIISMGLPDIFLPGSIVETDDSYRVAYDAKGCTSIMNVRNIKASTLIGCVCSILEKSKQAERRYFFTGEYSLDPGIVFVKTKFPEAYLIYNKTEARSKKEVLSDLARILKIPNRDKEGDIFLKKADEVLRDFYKSYFEVSHELKQMETLAFREGY